MRGSKKNMSLCSSLYPRSLVCLCAQDILNYLVAATLSVLLIALFQVDSLISAEIFPWTAPFSSLCLVVWSMLLSS